MKGVLIICEGRTDVEFIAGLLKSDGYQEFKNTLGNLPEPLYGYLKKSIDEFEYDSSRLRMGPLLPTVYVKNAQGSVYAILYAIDGTGNIEKAKKVVSDYGLLLRLGPKLKNWTLQLSLCFIFDSDQRGVDDTLDWVMNQFKDSINKVGNLLDTFDHSEFNKVGACILSGEDGYGTMEDMLMPLLSIGRETLYEQASTFLATHSFRRDKSGSTVIDENKTRADLRKSTIAVVGQFASSGLSNADTIRKDGAWKGNVAKSEKCNTIIKQINQMRPR